MGTFLDLSLDASLFPVRQAGESPEAFDARVKAWVLKNQTGLGIPQAMPKYEPAEDGSTLGDFDLSAGTAMPPVTHEKPPAPPPTAPPFREVVPSPPAEGARGCIVKIPGYHYPAVDIPGYYCEEAAGGAVREDPSPPRGEGMPPLWSPKPGTFGGPAGRIPAGMRDPWDPVAPSEGDLERLGILASTHFDVAWGTPPDRTGLTWDATRSVYQASADPWGRAYRDIGLSEAKYPQAYKDPSLGEAWGVRWVYVDVDPYRILPSNEGNALDLKILAKQSHLRGSEPETFSGGTERPIPEPKFPITPIGQAPRKQPDLGAFAWVPKEQLPFGCPYPYPYLPVPQADYTSGRWLEPDYAPSIPLPYPYDQAPWRCGVPSLPGGAKKGGGSGPPEPPPEPPLDFSVSTIDPDATNVIESFWDSSGAFDVGIPQPRGNAAPGDPILEEINTKIEEQGADQTRANTLVKELETSTGEDRKKKLAELEEIRKRGGEREKAIEDLYKEYRAANPGAESAPPRVNPMTIPPVEGLFDPPQPPRDQPPPPGERPPDRPMKPTVMEQAQSLQRLVDEWKKRFLARKTADESVESARKNVADAEAELKLKKHTWENRRLTLEHEAGTLSPGEEVSYQIQLRIFNQETERVQGEIDAHKKVLQAERSKAEAARMHEAVALGAVLEATRFQGGTGSPIEGYTPRWKSDPLLPSEWDRKNGVYQSELRISDTMQVGVFMNPATGYAEVVRETSQLPNVYDKSAWGTPMGMRDYESSGSINRFQVLTRRDGGGPVYEWWLFHGAVDRTWQSADAQGMWGDQDTRTKLVNRPKMKSNQTFRPQ